MAWNAYKVHTVLDTSPVTPSKKSATKLVLESLHKFLYMFQKHESECMPTYKLWDHMINLKDIFKAKKDRLIPLLLQEQEEVSAFIDKQLHKRYTISAHLNSLRCHWCSSFLKRMGISK